MNAPWAFLNGRWIPAAEAAVSVGDAGFVLGATIAEQLRTFAGRLFHLDKHLARLERSLDILGLDVGMTRDQLAQTAEELVARNFPLLPAGGDLGLSIFATPGVYPAYVASATGRPTVCLHTYPLPFRLWVEKYRAGQALRTTEVEQISPRCWPRELKCRSRMHYYLADRRADAVEPHSRALLLDADGCVTEASTANLLVYRRHEGLVSPPTEKILRGISLSTAVELARRLGMPFSERELTPDDVAAADEAMLCSTPWCLMPVSRLNGRRIGQACPGDVFDRLIAAWSELVAVDIRKQAEEYSGI